MRKETFRRITASLLAFTLTASVCCSTFGVQEVQAAVRGYSTENAAPSYGKPGEPKPVDVSFHVDDSGIYYADENNCQDYLTWLSDFVINKAEPQAVGMLLQIPCFREAAEQGLISKYIAFDTTYNDQNQFGAITQACYLGKNGNMAVLGQEPICNIAHHLTVNLINFGKETQNDPVKQRELQDTLVHEMLHAFMNDYTRNAVIGLHKDGSWNEAEKNGLPGWICEGIAVSLQAGYAGRRSEFFELLMLDENLPKEDLLTVLQDPAVILDDLAGIRDQALQQVPAEQYAEEYGSTDALTTSLTASENDYNLGYLGVMSLYIMAAYHMGLEPFDDYGTVQTDALLQGLDKILRMLHDGYSMDQIIAEISTDPETGVQCYADTADYESKFMQSEGDLGTMFAFELLTDFESRIEDPAVYVPSGSVLPGYNTYLKDFMDNDYHAAPPVFEIVTPDTKDEDSTQELFAVSTVPGYLTALGGGRRVSYAGAPALTDAEVQALKGSDPGGRAAFVDVNQGVEGVRSTNDWLWKTH